MLVPSKDTSFSRDTISNALINTDNKAFQAHKQQKEINRRVGVLESQLKELTVRYEQLEKLLINSGIKL